MLVAVTIMRLLHNRPELPSGPSRRRITRMWQVGGWPNLGDFLGVLRCPSSQVGPWPATGAGLRAVAFSCDLLQLFEEHHWTGWALSLRSFVAFCGAPKKNNTLLVGGFKYLLFSPLLGEMIHFD